MSKDLFSSPRKMIPGKLRKRHQIDFSNSPSKTRQSAKEGTQLDWILRKYATAGHSAEMVGAYFSIVAPRPYGIQQNTEYQDMLNKVIQVENYFAALPSRIRDRFNHSAQNMVDFLADPKNLDEARKLGLVAKELATGADVPAAKPAETLTVPSPDKKETPK